MELTNRQKAEIASQDQQELLREMTGLYPVSNAPYVGKVVRFRWGPSILTGEIVDTFAGGRVDVRLHEMSTRARTFCIMDSDIV